MILHIEIHLKVHEDIKLLKKEHKNHVVKFLELLFAIQKDPFRGLGHPEPLKGDFSGLWSRRISQKHRLIYKVEDDTITIFSCYGHYDDG